MRTLLAIFLTLLVSVPALADFDARMAVIRDPVIGPVLKDRVACALMIQACVVKIEGIAVPSHNLRDTFAQRVINWQVSFNPIYVYIVNDANVSALIDAGTLGLITDTILLQAVTDGWNNLSGVSELAE